MNLIIGVLDVFFNTKTLRVFILGYVSLDARALRLAKTLFIFLMVAFADVEDWWSF